MSKMFHLIAKEFRLMSKAFDDIMEIIGNTRKIRVLNNNRINKNKTSLL